MRCFLTVLAYPCLVWFKGESRGAAVLSHRHTSKHQCGPKSVLFHREGSLLCASGLASGLGPPSKFSLTLFKHFPAKRCVTAPIPLLVRGKSDKEWEGERRGCEGEGRRRQEGRRESEMKNHQESGFTSACRKGRPSAGTW